VRITRWIIFPLVFAAAMIIPELIFPDRLTFGKIIFKFCWGVVGGLVTVAWTDRRARRRSGTHDEEIYKVRQSRRVTVALDVARAVELCREAATSIDGMRLRSANEATQEVIARSRLKWESFGNIITMRAVRLGENLTEIQITTRPVLKTVIIGSGISWEEANEIAEYLRKHDARLEPRHLVEGAEILNSATVRPITRVFENLNSTPK